jgi:hypothetical protein
VIEMEFVVTLNLSCGYKTVTRYPSNMIEEATTYWKNLVLSGSNATLTVEKV